MGDAMGVEVGLLMPLAQLKIQTGICFFVRGGEVLLLERTNGPEAGHLGTYTTEVQPGETFSTAIVREIDAEAGVGARAKHLRMVAKTDDEHMGDGVIGRHHTHIFLLTRWKGMPVPSAKWRYPEWVDIALIGKKLGEKHLIGIKMSQTQFIMNLQRAAAK
jgi:ADP-ribose pyrophosphatase YjhB (NUDIX family)